MNWLLKARGMTGLTQRQVAEIIGISRPTYADIEKHRPEDLSLRQLEALIAAGFHVPYAPTSFDVCPTCMGSGLVTKPKGPTMSDAEQNPYICCVCHDQSGPHCDDCKELCQPAPPAPLVEGHGKMPTPLLVDGELLTKTMSKELDEWLCRLCRTVSEPGDHRDRMAAALTVVITPIIGAHLQAAVRESTERLEDDRWLIDECWELRNKPWRLFNTLADYIEKYGDNSSQDIEAITELRSWAAWAGKGNNPGGKDNAA